MSSKGSCTWCRVAEALVSLTGTGAAAAGGAGTAAAAVATMAVDWAGPDGFLAAVLFLLLPVVVHR